MEKKPGRNPLENVSAFRRALCGWFETQGKDYPWRRTRDPYAILVSELMLQQTRIQTVLERGYYSRWMERFPNTAVLAGAPEAEVLQSWEGLGYYNRARNLQKAALKIEEEHAGRFPIDMEGLLDLPGVGRYTAGAVASFAFNRPAPIVDGNVARVLTRLLEREVPIDSKAGQRWLWETAETLLAPRKAAVFNSAIMELGQTFCGLNPACQECPVSAFCLSRKPETLPKKERKKTMTERQEAVAFLTRGRAVLLTPDPARSGMWRLPEASAAEKAGAILHRLRYTITRYRVQLTIHPGQTRRREGLWVPREDLADYPMRSPYRKALEVLLAGASQPQLL
ncbi:MAG: A/G-specific adenine glycosylase [Verrucomicrobiota bacterium]